MKKTFQKFTNQYELSKTLRFELKLQSQKNKELLLQIIEDDMQKDALYHQTMKPLFDELHNRFIQEALGKVAFEIEILEELEEKFSELKKLSKKRKENEKAIIKLESEIAILQAKLRNVIGNIFKETGNEWKKNFLEKYEIKINDAGYKILTNANILKILKKEQEEKGDDEKIKAIETFERFFMYFDGFNQNRENYYTTEDKKTGVTFRIINENLPRFLENKKLFAEIQKEIKSLSKYEKDFSLENFQNLLVQNATDDFNEEVVGKINYEVNQWNQQKKTRLPKLHVLYKQIGSDKAGKEIFEIEEGKEWQEIQNLKNEQHTEKELNKENKKLLDTLKIHYESFFSGLDHFKLEEVYFNKQSINTVSSFWFLNWKTFADILEIKTDKKSGEQKIPTQVSLFEIKKALEGKENVLEKDEEGNEKSSLLSFFRSGKNKKYEKLFGANAWETFLNIWKSEIENNFLEIERFENELEKLKQENFSKKKHGKFVKALCDAYLSIERMAKYHTVKEGNAKDTNFYDVFDWYLEENILKKYYNAFRNYIAKKPFNEEKIKLNFNCGYLLGGWAQEYETYGSLIFKKDGKFYLGIINGTKLSKNEKKSLFENIDDKNEAYKFIYLTQKIDNKNPPRWFIRSKGDTFAPMVREGLLNPKSILDIYDHNLYSKTKNKENYKKYLPKLIDYFKEGFQKHKDFKNFDFNWDESDKYDNVAKFYEHTASMCYKTDWEKINFENLKKLEEEGRIFLFQIYNKDFGKTKVGSKQNLHTMLFLELLKPENAKYLKLMGGGEIFYRKATDVKKLNKKQDRKGNEVIDGKRYAEDKLFLHFPVAIKGTQGNLKKDEVNEFLAKNKDEINIIGIDRGEKHLLYYSVIDSAGKILEQNSFNRIETQNEVDEKELKVEYNDRNEMVKAELVSTGNKVRYVDYHLLLDYYEKKRIIARKNWEVIGKIKELKEGYLSHVIYQIYQLMMKYNAIVVMEDLNTEFKAKRTAKVEKAIYKKFELALAKKLNNLILKDKQPNEKGGVLHSYQLTPKIESRNISYFEKAKQWGFLFYVRANYTSITDPITGWRQNIYLKYKTSKKKGPEETKNEIVSKLQKIEFKNGQFEFKDSGKGWTVCSSVERFHWNNQKRKTDHFPLEGEKSLTNQFQEIFKNAEIKISENILDQIKELHSKGNEQFFKRFVFLWSVLCQIRNSDYEATDQNKQDFLFSPVERNGQFFDSREPQKFGKKLENGSWTVPENGDANGAFNIARKGLMLLERIEKSPFDYDGLILDQDWDDFIQE